MRCAMMLVLSLLDHEPLWYSTANIKIGARLDVLLETFWVEISSMRIIFMLGCLTPLRAPIFASHSSGATLFINKRNVRLMMNGFGW